LKVEPERTLVLVKPDGVKRGLVGRILNRFEEVGLKIVGLKMVSPSREQVERHYPNTPEWISGMGHKTLKSYEEHGVDPVAEMGTRDPMAIGEMVKNWNIDYLTSGPIVAVVLEGYHAIAVVRKLCGHTLPLNAEPGSIRGMFSSGSPIVANATKRAIRNLIHASSTVEEANHEMGHWFPEGRLAAYDRPDTAVIF
jgi:nucleoside-diphosphate kinase